MRILKGSTNYRRALYMTMVLIVMCLGLLSRKFSSYIPDAIDLYLGDSLWALMIYLLTRMMFVNWSKKKAAFVGILFCFMIELSQLYHSGWIDDIRKTTLGGLILGYGFLWSDLALFQLKI